MLEKARERVQKNGFDNVHLLSADATKVAEEAIWHVLGEEAPIDTGRCSNALVAMPQWESVFHHMFGLLRPGGQLLMLETFAERYEFRYLEGSPHVLDGRPYVATGFAPELAS